MDDANELIELAREAGLIDVNDMKDWFPNATECLTRADVEKSHTVKHQRVVLKIDNIYGMIILLAIGLGGAKLIALAELIVHKVGKKKDDPNRVIVI